jgi:hypothetical protein
MLALQIEPLWEGGDKKVTKILNIICENELGHNLSV